MKTKSFFAIAVASFMMVSCGGSKNEAVDTVEEAAEEEISSTEVVLGDDVMFVDEDGNDFTSVEFVPGTYTLDNSGYSLKLKVKTTVKSEDSRKISGESSVIILDENGNEVGTMGIYGGTYDLNYALEKGKIGEEYELEFTVYPDDKAAFLTAAKTIKPGVVGFRDTTPSSSDDDDDDDDSYSSSSSSSSGSSSTFNGVTYNFKYSADDNDSFLNSTSSVSATDYNKLAEVYERYEEELVRYYIALGGKGKVDPMSAAAKRLRKFNDKWIGEGKPYSVAQSLRYDNDAPESFKSKLRSAEDRMSAINRALK